jgi:hypothetical protein
MTSHVQAAHIWSGDKVFMGELAQNVEADFPKKALLDAT